MVVRPASCFKMNAPNRKAPGVSDDSKGLMTITNDADSATYGPLDQAPASNAIAYQIARLALAGHHVHKRGEGDFIVCKYGLTRWCKDFAELKAFALKLGVRND